MQRSLLVLVVLFSVSTARADIIPSCPPGQHAERGPSVDGHPGPSSCVADAPAEPTVVPVADVEPAAEPVAEPAAAEPAEEGSSGCSIGQGRGAGAWILLGLALVGSFVRRRRA